MGKIESVFDKVARCTLEYRYESTDASKILHTIVPEFFVMWDRNIRRAILGSEYRRFGYDYAYTFLPRIQAELKEAIITCMEDKGFHSEDESIEYIRRMCDGNTLAKLVDEYNYVVYTLKIQL